MAEYIEREAVKFSLDSLLFMNKRNFTIGDFETLIDIQPAADVVEVVRCKDCKQWRRNLGLIDSPNGHCFYHCIDTNGNDFCSYGEKKDGKGEGE